MRRILYLQYTNPAAYPPLEHSAQLLAEAGWQVRFLGSGASGAADQLRFISQPNIDVRQRRYPERGWRQKLDYLVYGLWALWHVWTWRPRWVYASDPLICPVALLVRWLTPAAVLYHEHDSPDEAQAKPRARFDRLILLTRRLLARRATLCVLPNAQRIEVFRQSTGRTSRVECVWNCPRRDEVANPRVKSGEPAGLHLYYHGSLVPVRLPMTIPRAMHDCPGSRLTIVGYETIGSSGYTQSFETEIARLGLREQFEVLGVRTSREDLLKLCPPANVGIALMPTHDMDLNENTMVGASNKPFDYLTRGMALLVADRPDWRAAFVEPGYALPCEPNDAESVARALRWFAEHPGETLAMGERGRQRLLDGWNYEAQFAPVMAILEHADMADATSPPGNPTAKAP